MGVTAKWRSGVATDAGRMRPDNEDRSYWGGGQKRLVVQNWVTVSRIVGRTSKGCSFRERR